MYLNRINLLDTNVIQNMFVELSSSEFNLCNKKSE